MAVCMCCSGSSRHISTALLICYISVALCCVRLSTCGTQNFTKADIWVPHVRVHVVGNFRSLTYMIQHTTHAQSYRNEHSCSTVASFRRPYKEDQQMKKTQPYIHII